MSGMREFGALIKSARERMGWTGVELATRLDRPHSFVVRIENGQNANPPDTRTFSDLSRLLDLDKVRMLIVLGYLDSDVNEERDDDEGSPKAYIRGVVDHYAWDWEDAYTAGEIIDSLKKPRRKR